MPRTSRRDGVTGLVNPRARAWMSPATDGPLGRSRGGQRAVRVLRFLDVPRALRWTGGPQLISFYRYFAFAGPRTTTGVAVVFALAVAAVTMAHLVAGTGRPVYAAVGLGVSVVASVAAGWGVLRGRPWAWWLGSALAVVWVVVYLVSRLVGLPGLPEAVDRWDDPAGTAGMGLAGAFVALHVAVLTGVLVAVPGRRTWRD